MEYRHTRAFAIDIEVSCCISECFLCISKGCSISSEHSSSQSIFGRAVDQLADLFERIRFGVVVDVCSDYGTEELSAEVLMIRILGSIDRGMDEVAFRLVVFPTHDQFQIIVILCSINDSRKFLEARLVNDRANKKGRKVSSMHCTFVPDIRTLP
jgi:hypothetical protein